MHRKLSIGILGSRGIPNNYGGYEQFAGELGVRLVEKGYEVSVYTVAEHPLKDPYYKGIRRILVKNPETRLGTFGQFLYDLYSNLDSRKRKFDIILHLGYTSDSVWYRLWTGKSIHLTNMDGLEWKRSKYSKSVRKFLLYAEKLATLKSKMLIADSYPIREYLEKHYDKPVRYLSYGAAIPEVFSKEVPESLKLVPGAYDLIIARFVPENNIETSIRAKLNANDDIPLAIFGNQNEYRRLLEKKYAGGEKILFCEPVYEKEKIDSIRKFARFYIHGHSVGGTNPSLLEAMACNCNIIAHDNPFNRAVLQKDAFYFGEEKDLSAIFESTHPGDFEFFRNQNLGKIRDQYNWDIITEGYEELFIEAINTSLTD